MASQLNDLGKALTNQIYHTVLGGDDKVPPRRKTHSLLGACRGVEIAAGIVLLRR